MTTLHIACDHAAFDLKQALLTTLRAALPEGITTLADHGCPSPEAVNYPDVVARLAEAMQPTAETDKALLLCGSGVGVAIAANRFAWLRAAHVHDETLARLSRAHNNANVLCLGARFVAPAQADYLVRTWLATPFEGERHLKRVAALATLGQA
jgi:ribose 5-phosphate isomerase B